MLVPSWRPHGIDRFSLCLCVKRESESEKKVCHGGARSGRTKQFQGRGGRKEEDVKEENRHLI